MRPYLRVANIFEDRIDLSDVLEMNFSPDEYKVYELKFGDILLNEGQSLELVGRPAMYRDELPGACFQNTLVRFRAGEAILPRFALLIFRHYLHAKRFQKIARWTVNIAHLGGGRFAELEFPVPPLNEQTRIVAKAEELLSDIDAGVFALERVRANLKKYRAAVLKAAVTGELTAKWRAAHPEVEPATEVIKRVPTPPRPARFGTRSKGVIQGHAALSVGATGAPLPTGWAWSPLVDIARMETGHTPSRQHPEWWNGDIPWVGIADAKAHHRGLVFDTIQHTNQAGLDNSAARLLPIGTVCISRTASVGYVVELGEPMATSQDFVNWVPTEAVTSGWLRVVFMADREALLRFGKGSVHTTIYFPEWLSVHIAVPPVAEQLTITADVEERLSVIKATEDYIAASLKRAARLRQGILKEAFAGRLVSQDPADEPASVLLDRIRQTRPSAASVPAKAKARNHKPRQPDLFE
jgi:type I restriction enzyme S subunit